MKIACQKYTIYRINNIIIPFIPFTHYVETCESVDMFICISKNISQRRAYGSLLLVSKEMTWYQRKFVNLKIVWNVHPAANKNSKLFFKYNLTHFQSMFHFYTP